MKKILISAVVALTLTACAQNETETAVPENGTRQIEAVSDIEGVATRAVVGTQAALDGIVFVRYDDVATNKTAGFDFSASAAISGSRAAGVSGAITFSPAQSYDKANDKTAYLVGYHPAGTLTSKVATWTLDGATDILMTDVWNAGRYSSPLKTGMTFRHVLARIEVICQAESGSALSVVQAAWGNITAIKFADALPAMTYTYATNTVAASGTKADFPLLNGATYAKGAFTAVGVPATGNKTVTASAMLAPVDSKTVTLKVTTATGGEKSLPITLSGNFEKGKVHTVTLTFKANGKDIDVTSSSIVDWGTGYAGNSDVTI